MQINSNTAISGPGAAHVNCGVVTAIRGSVVDVLFEKRLPPIYTLLLTGPQRRIALEVLAQLDAHRVRGIALTPTGGLARGMAVEDTGGPLRAPVGRNILSRMFDVFGNAIDRQEQVADVEWRSVHRPPPPLARRSTKSEIFETGIKVIDVLVPLERGGKAGLVRRGRRGQDGVAHRDDSQHRRASPGREHLLRHWRTLSRRRGAVPRYERTPACCRTWSWSLAR